SISIESAFTSKDKMCFTVLPSTLVTTCSFSSMLIAGMLVLVVGTGESITGAGFGIVSALETIAIVFGGILSGEEERHQIRMLLSFAVVTIWSADEVTR